MSKWAQEFDLRRIRAGEAFLDMEALREAAGAVEWIGEEPRAGHRYAKGIDVAGPGQDLTVHTVIDLDAHPAQVVFQKAYPQEPIQTKVARIEDLEHANLRLVAHQRNAEDRARAKAGLPVHLLVKPGIGVGIGDEGAFAIFQDPAGDAMPAGDDDVHCGHCRAAGAARDDQLQVALRIDEE